MSAGRRPLAVRADINFGDYYQGRTVGFGLDSKWRMSYQLSLDLRYSRNQIQAVRDQCRGSQTQLFPQHALFHETLYPVERRPPVRQP